MIGIFPAGKILYELFPHEIKYLVEVEDSLFMSQPKSNP